MIVASQSENGQVLHVIPSAQPGVAQVIIPQGQLLDVTSTQGEFKLWNLRVCVPLTKRILRYFFFFKNLLFVYFLPLAKVKRQKYIFTESAF